MTQCLYAPSIIGALTGASSSITNALLPGPSQKTRARLIYMQDTRDRVTTHFHDLQTR